MPTTLIDIVTNLAILGQVTFDFRHWLPLAKPVVTSWSLSIELFSYVLLALYFARSSARLWAFLFVRNAGLAKFATIVHQARNSLIAMSSTGFASSTRVREMIVERFAANVLPMIRAMHAMGFKSNASVAAELKRP